MAGRVTSTCVLGIGEEGVMFSSGTGGFHGSHLEMQDDGNLVVYDVNHVARWANNTENRARMIGNLRDLDERL